MKILTLTTQYANNMGALLQCYALSKFLNNQEGIDCQVIQYFPINHDRSWKILRKPRSVKELFITCYSLFRIDHILLFNKKKAMMRKFINLYLPLTNEKYYVGDLQKKPPIADAVIVGSDQVWNFRLRKDLSFFLNFLDSQPDCKRIAYAPSIADPWTNEEEEEVRPLLQKFDALSIRESFNLPQVQKLSPNNNPMVVLDPVFLLGQKVWDNIKRTPSVKKPYILCYFLSPSSLAVSTVKKVKELTGMPVVHLNVNEIDKFNSDINIKVADPCDFIGLIADASFVVTNSFHCSAFSVMYRKDFFFIPKSSGNSRIEGIRSLFCTGDFFMSYEKLTSLKQSDLHTDYTKTDEAENNVVNHSKQFLLNAIKQ